MEKSEFDPTDFDWAAASPAERDRWLAQNVVGTSDSRPYTTCPDAELSLLKEVRSAWREPMLLALAEALWDTYLARREAAGAASCGLFDALHVLYHERGDYADAVYLVASKWHRITTREDKSTSIEIAAILDEGS